MTEKRNTENKVNEIINIIKELKTTELPILIEEIKKVFKVTETNFSQPSNQQQNVEEKAAEEEPENVSIKILGWSEGVTPAVKIQAYKLICEISKDLGKDIGSIIQAKKMVEEEQVLAENVFSGRAKEIQEQLSEKGIKVSFETK